MDPDYGELVESFGQSTSHGSTLPKSPIDGEYKLPVQGGIVLITLSHPHTDKWVNLTTKDQKDLLYRLFQYCVSVADPINIVRMDHVYEYHKTGHVHLHGYVIFRDDLKLYPIGAVADMAKLYHSKMPKEKWHRYHLYNDKHLYSQYGRYRDPGCCFQYLYSDDSEGLNRWIKYIYKDQGAERPEPTGESKKTNPFNLLPTDDEQEV